MAANHNRSGGIHIPQGSPPSLKKATSPLSPISPWPPLFVEEEESTTSKTKDAIPAVLTQEDTLPTSKEIYGSIAILLTSLGYFMYLSWASLDPATLDGIGWTWYPSREWALIVPCWLMMVVLLAYLTYAGLTAFSTPPFHSSDLITDSYSNLPSMQNGKRYYWKIASKDIMPPAVDLPIDLVNRVLYPARPRPRSRTKPST